MRRALAAGVIVALAVPAAAGAHATVRQTAPKYRERVERSPDRALLRFDQRVTALPGSIRVYSSTGKLVSRAARRGQDARSVVAALPSLSRGGYTVRWNAISSDGHVISGVFTFGVRAAAPPPTEAYGAGGPTRAEHAVRWAYFVALALVLGGLGFRLFALPRRLPARAERRFWLVTGIGVVATLEAGIAAFILRAEDALQLPFARLLYGDLSPIAGGTRFGAAFIAMTLGFALVAALLFLAWLSDRRALLWGAFAVGLGFASGLSLSGHSAADRGSGRLSVLADWVHLSAACLWVGGLVQLAVVVWPVAPELRRDAFLRFSRLASGLVALVLCTGVYLSVLRLPHVSDLWTEHYGHVLLVKLALVALALTWGAVHHFVARPALERGDAGMLGRLPRSLAGETAVAVAVLLAAAVLVDSKPPPERSAPPGAAAADRR